MQLTQLQRHHEAANFESLFGITLSAWEAGIAAEVHLCGAGIEMLQLEGAVLERISRVLQALESLPERWAAELCLGVLDEEEA